jgi:hypothetical protein
LQARGSGNLLIGPSIGAEGAMVLDCQYYGATGFVGYSFLPFVEGHAGMVYSRVFLWN